MTGIHGGADRPARTRSSPRGASFLLTTLTACLLGGAAGALQDLGTPGKSPGGQQGGPITAPGHTKKPDMLTELGDGTKDATAHLQQMIDNCATAIDLPVGTFLITDTLVIRDCYGLRLRGQGPGTQLIWRPSNHPGSLTGGDGKPMIAIQDSARCSVESLQIVNASAWPLPAAVRLESMTDPAPIPCAENVLRDVDVFGGKQGVERGVQVALGPGGDVANNHHVFDQVRVFGYRDAAFSLEHSTASGIQLRNCRFEGGGTGLAGVRTDRGACPDGSGTHCAGSFRWYGGGGGGNLESDFMLGDVVDTLIIQGGEFSGSARFLHSGGPSGNQWPVVVQGVTWRDDGLGTLPDCPWPQVEQMRIMHFQFRGPLVFTGNHFGIPPDVVYGPAVAKPAELIWNPGGNYGEFVFQGNYIATSKANPFTGLTATGSTTGIYPTVQRANLVGIDDFGGGPQRLGQHASNLSGNSKPTVGWLSTGREMFTTTGGTDIEHFNHGVVGQRITVRALGARRILHGTNIQLAGGVDFDMQPGDTLSLLLVDPTLWVETARCVASPGVAAP